MGESFWAGVRFGPATREVAQEVATRDGCEVVALGTPVDHGVWCVDETILEVSGVGVWELCDQIARYGTEQFRENGVLEYLREQGVPYRAHDDGKYEIPGVVEDWRPGMLAPRERPNAGEAGPALTERDWHAILASAPTDVGVLALNSWVVRQVEAFFAELVDLDLARTS